MHLDCVKFLQLKRQRADLNFKLLYLLARLFVVIALSSASFSAWKKKVATDELWQMLAFDNSTFHLIQRTRLKPNVHYVSQQTDIEKKTVENGPVKMINCKV